MEKNDAESKLIGRRRTLQIFGIGLAAGGALMVAACKKDEPADTNNAGGGSGTTATNGGGAQDCNAEIDEGSKTMRRNLQYHAKAAVPEKHCSVCAQFIPGKYAECGGGCKLIGGPVKPEGGCLSFAPMGADAAPPT